MNLPEKWCINLRNAPKEVIDYCNKHGERPQYKGCSFDVYAHFPAVNIDGNFCTTAFRRKEYTEITHEQFLNRRTYPVVKGGQHHIKAFIKDIENIGLRFYNLMNEPPTVLKLNGNNFEPNTKIPDEYVVVGKSWTEGYTKSNVEGVAYQLPQDWNAALAHFEKCKVWRDEAELKEKRFVIGTLTYVVNTTGIYFLDFSGSRVKSYEFSKWEEVFNYYNEIRK